MAEHSLDDPSLERLATSFPDDCLTSEAELKSQESLYVLINMWA